MPECELPAPDHEETASMPTYLPPPELNVPDELLEAWNRHSDIVKLGENSVLREVAKPVVRHKDVEGLIKRMEAVMREAHGLGLAAPQVGVSTRLIMYDSGEGLRVIIN